MIITHVDGWPVAGYENPGYPQSPMETGVLSDMLRGAAIALVEHKPNQQQHILNIQM